MGKKNFKSVELCKIMNYMKSVVQQHLVMPFLKHKEKVLLTEIVTHPKIQIGKYFYISYLMKC